MSTKRIPTKKTTITISDVYYNEWIDVEFATTKDYNHYHSLIEEMDVRHICNKEENKISLHYKELLIRLLFSDTPL